MDKMSSAADHFGQTNPSCRNATSAAPEPAPLERNVQARQIPISGVTVAAFPLGQDGGHVGFHHAAYQRVKRRPVPPAELGSRFARIPEQKSTSVGRK